jgi:hypothetical protein
MTIAACGEAIRSLRRKRQMHFTLPPSFHRTYLSFHAARGTLNISD